MIAGWLGTLWHDRHFMRDRQVIGRARVLGNYCVLGGGENLAIGNVAVGQAAGGEFCVCRVFGRDDDVGFHQVIVGEVVGRLWIVIVEGAGLAGLSGDDVRRRSVRDPGGLIVVVVVGVVFGVRARNRLLG